MGNNANMYSTNKINILCNKCPLIPIINITSTKEGTLIYEYRCPYFHMGYARLEEAILNNNSRKYGCKCDICKTKKENVPDGEKYKFCGVCQKFICDKCLKDHNEFHSNHIILPYSKINILCLYHGENYKFYCFTCLRSICPKCFGHKNHCFKPLNEIGQNENILKTLNYSFDEVYDFFNSITNSKYINYNWKNYNNYKKRNILLLNLVKNLYKIYIAKKETNSLNGEIIINLLNLSKFNFNSKMFYINPNLFFKSHLILKSKPVSSICSFTKTKASYKVGELTPVFFKDLNLNKDECNSMVISRMDFDLIAYNIGNILYFMKNEEKIYFKIDIKEKIKNYFQLKKHIVCIYSGNDFYFYKLIKLNPYIIQFSVQMPNISNAIQVYGCIYNDLYIINDKNYIYKIKQNKNELNSKCELSLDIDKSLSLKSNNKSRENNNKNKDDNSDILTLNNNRINNDNNDNNESDNSYGTKIIIKGIVYNFLVMIENNRIILRNKNSFLKNINYLEIQQNDFIIYNSHILLTNKNEIMFYSIPDFKIVSTVIVTESINSLLVPNKNMLLVIGESSIEQFELNTWKKISKLYGIKNFVLQGEFTLIGNTNELYLFSQGLIFKFKSISI
jgi:hypothetical protein